MDVATVLVVTAGFLAGLIVRSKGVSVEDFIQGMLVYIPALMASLYATTILGITGTITLGGWMGTLLTAMGPLGSTILGPVIVGIFYGLALMVTALLSYLAMWKIKP